LSEEEGGAPPFFTTEKRYLFLDGKLPIL